LLLRFSKDLDQIDNQLPNSMGTILASTLQIITSVVAICVVTPSFAVYMLAIFSLYYSVTNYYRPIARELKRLESTSRSPIYSHFSETLNGLTTIRSFHRDESYQMINQAKLDDHLSVYILLKTLDRWLSFRLEMLGNVIVLFSSLLAVFTASKAGSVGLSLNNALAVIGSLNWAVRNAAETENLMNSVEKVYKLIDETPQERSTELNQFQTVNDFVFPKDSSLSMIESTTATDYGKESGTVSAEEGDLSASLKKLDEEGEGEDDDLSYGAKEIIDDSSSLAENQQQKDDHPFLDSIDELLAEKNEEPSIEEELAQRPIHSDDDLLTLGWPRKGEIIFSNVTMKYREDYDPVLRKVNLIIKPGEKIGIVGRTGSGKR
jgi:ABC-type multidrug transport system fused ATPase/permease subunit